MLRQLKVSNAGLTALKLLGLLVMLIDHYNAFVKPEYSPVMYELGRLALPLFVFVLGYNLARIPPEKMPHIILRLLLFGMIATPVYNLLDGDLWGWWPLNILFTLLVATSTLYLWTLSVAPPLVLPMRLAAVLLFAVAGALVDYLWVGPALVVVIWRLFSLKSDSERTVFYGALALLLVLLCWVNKSLAAVFALAIIPLLLLYYQNRQLPRMKWFFYWFYPAHLFALLLLQRFVGG